MKIKFRFLILSLLISFFVLFISFQYSLATQTDHVESYKRLFIIVYDRSGSMVNVNYMKTMKMACQEEEPLKILKKMNNRLVDYLCAKLNYKPTKDQILLIKSGLTGDQGNDLVKAETSEDKKRELLKEYFCEKEMFASPKGEELLIILDDQLAKKIWGDRDFRRGRSYPSIVMPVLIEEFRQECFATEIYILWLTDDQYNFVKKGDRSQADEISTAYLWYVEKINCPKIRSIQRWWNINEPLL